MIDYDKVIISREKLESQLRENISVLQVKFRIKIKQELKLLKDTDNVFKSVGNILLLQKKDEPVETVNKRLDYIKSEM